MVTSVCPLPLRTSDTYGSLTIGTTEMVGPAWTIPDLSPLGIDPDVRQESVLIEGQPGRVARPGLPDETDVSLAMVFSGATDQDGVSWPNPAGGLLINRRQLQTDVVVAARAEPDGTLPAVLSEPDPTDPEGDDLTYVADVIPLRLIDWQLRPNGYAVAVLEVRIPVWFVPVVGE